MTPQLLEQPIELKGGHETFSPVLDRIAEFDEQSKDYPIISTLRSEQRHAPRSYTWRVGHWLDQGREGRCVEFGICHELLARPVKVPRAGVDEILRDLAIYHPAQHDDPWDGCYLGSRCPIRPGPQYEGTSVLSGIKQAVKLGYFSEYRWAFGIDDLILALGYKGPAVLGVNWYEGMFRPGADGFIRPTGRLGGGHAILANSVKLFFTGPRRMENIDHDRSYVLLHNSWGEDWGNRGTCKISLTDLATLLGQRGEACIPVLRTQRRAA